MGDAKTNRKGRVQLSPLPMVMLGVPFPLELCSYLAQELEKLRARPADKLQECLPILFWTKLVAKQLHILEFVTILR